MIKFFFFSVLFENRLSIKSCEESRIVQIGSLTSSNGFKFYNSSNK